MPMSRLYSHSKSGSKLRPRSLASYTRWAGNGLGVPCFLTRDVVAVSDCMFLHGPRLNDLSDGPIADWRLHSTEPAEGTEHSLLD